MCHGFNSYVFTRLGMVGTSNLDQLVICAHRRFFFSSTKPRLNSSRWLVCGEACGKLWPVGQGVFLYDAGIVMLTLAENTPWQLNMA